MKYIIYILFFVCFGLSVKAQVPTGFPSQRWAGWIEPTYVVPDSGTIITKRDTSFIPRFVGTTVTWQRPGIDTTFWFWNGAHWGRVTLAQLDTTSLSNRINLKLNISDTASMLLPYLRKVDTLNKWVQNVYSRNDSLFKLKNGTETFVHTFPTSGSGTVTSISVSVPAAMSVTPSTITTSGTFNFSGAGLASQYVKGDFTLGTTDTSMIPNFFSKVRSEFSGTSPITYNSTTGIIGILNANSTGQKGAATFNNSDFTDNGSALISLAPIGSGGSCLNCQLTIDTKGRITSFADGSIFLLSNAPGAGDTLVVSGDTIKRVYASYGLISTPTASSIALRVDTTLIQKLITANNGLTKTGDNIQLGGSLIQATNITSAAGANRIIYSGVSSFGDGAQLDVSTTGSAGIGVRGQTIDGRGIFGVATTGVGVYGTATGTGGYGLFGLSTLGNAIYGRADSGLIWEGAMVPHSNNTIIPARSTTRASQAPGANGIGYSDDSYLQTSTGSNRLSNQIIYKLTNATDASYASSFEFWNANNATLARKMAIAGNGQITLDQYIGTNFQTIDTSYNSLVVDGSGNIFKRAGGSGSLPQSIVDTVNKYMPKGVIYSDSIYMGNGNDSTWRFAVIGADLYVQRHEPAGFVTKGIFSVEDDIIVLDSVPFVGTTWDAFGDSYTAGVGASPSSNAYIPLLQTALSMTANNVGESGTGIMDVQFKMYRDFAAFKQVNRRSTTMMIGFNDYLKSNSGTATQTMFPYAFRAALFNHFLDTAIASNDPGLTISGSWSTFDLSASYPQKSKYLLSGTGRLSVASSAGAYISYTFNGNNVGIIFLGANGTTQNYGRLKIEIDGTIVDTIVENGIADNQSVFANSSTRTEDLISAAKVYTGLTNGGHTIKATLLDNQNTNIDAFGIMADPLNCKSMVVGGIEKLLSAGYTAMNGSFPKNDAGVDATNTIISNLVNEFRHLGYPVVFDDVNTFTTPSTDIGVDNIHWNNSGHLHGKNSFRAKIKL